MIKAWYLYGQAMCELGSSSVGIEALEKAVSLSKSQKRPSHAVEHLTTLLHT